MQKLKSITKCGNVSLIGISWGGPVCVLMAQLLEADNTAVSLTLLEGIPDVIQEWTKSLLQYGNINAKLLLNYFQISSAVISIYYCYQKICIHHIIFTYRTFSDGQRNINEKRLEYRVT